MTGGQKWIENCQRVVLNGTERRPDSSSALNSGQGSEQAYASSDPNYATFGSPPEGRVAARLNGQCAFPELA